MRTWVSIFLIAAILSAASQADGLDLYVGPTGNDAWGGLSAVPNEARSDGPLATIDGARQAIRKLRQKQAELGTTQPITVHIAAGDYLFPDRSFELTTQDSGTAHGSITYRNAGNGEVRLVGGKLLPGKDFQPITDPSTLEILPAESREHVHTINLNAIGVDEYGTYPDAFRSPPTIPELFFNDQRMTLARWPNQEWATIAKVIESGPAKWRNHKSEEVGVFEYSGDRPSRWTKAVWLVGYWCFDWAEETIRVKHIDTAKRQITLGSQHYYGLGGGNPPPRRYYAVNLLEELDSPGEYYIDRQQGRLYFWPPGPLQGARIVLSTLTAPLLSLRDASYITLRGLTIEACAGNSVAVTDGRNVRIEACRVRNIGQTGIVVEGGLQHSINNCEIHDTGGIGVSVKGGDRKTLTSSGHEVVNNHIYRPSRRKLTIAGHINLSGVGVRVAHNLLHDAPHLAILLYGNDHVIEYNEIHHVAKETDDCGAFYMGRNPSARGTIIRYNFWHDIGSKLSHGSCAVYFDDGAGGQTVFGNVFYRAASGNFGAVFIHGGHDNIVDNNVFIECKQAIAAFPGTISGGRTMSTRRCGNSGSLRRWTLLAPRTPIAIPACAASCSPTERPDSTTRRETWLSNARISSKGIGSRKTTTSQMSTQVSSTQADLTSNYAMTRSSFRRSRDSKRSLSGKSALCAPTRSGKCHP
ncbi:MAG: right-handed parallel beta-helix repeat-containing protein [Planctomycetota bacterium]|jgi:hypothetical protein